MQNVNRFFVSDDGKSYGVWLHKRLTISGHWITHLLLNKNDQGSDVYHKVLQECAILQTVEFSLIDTIFTIKHTC